MFKHQLMPRLRPRNRPVFSGFTNSEIEKMEILLKELGKLSLGREFCQMVASSFNCSAGRAGKPATKWTEVQSWFQSRLQDSQDEAKDHECKEGKNIQNSSEIEFEARSSTDGAWYDVEKFLGHRFLRKGEAQVHIRFSGFGAEEDEWVNVRNAIRERSVPFENTECSNLKVGDQVLCFQERMDHAIHYDAHILEIQRKMHDIRGCRCLFVIRYDHDNNEERVHLGRMCRRKQS